MANAERSATQQSSHQGPQSGFEALHRYWRRGRASRPGETLPDKLLAHIAPLGLGAHQLQWRLRLAVRTAQTGVSALRNLRSAFLDAAERTI